MRDSSGYVMIRPSSFHRDDISDLPKVICLRVHRDGAVDHPRWEDVRIEVTELVSKILRKQWRARPGSRAERAAAAARFFFGMLEGVI